MWRVTCNPLQLWSGAIDASVSFDFNVRETLMASPFRDVFAQETLVYAMGLWPRARESFFQSLCTNVGVVGCFTQPVNPQNTVPGLGDIVAMTSMWIGADDARFAGHQVYSSG